MNKSYSINQIIIQNIKKIRLERYLTQKDIALAINIKTHSYSHYENGDRLIPIEVIIKLCQYYQIDINILFKN